MARGTEQVQGCFDALGDQPPGGRTSCLTPALRDALRRELARGTPVGPRLIAPSDPTIPTDPNPFRNRQPIEPSGLAIAAIPRPAEAPLVWDMPDWNPIKEPCTSMDLRPAHAKGVNVIYADCHAKFSPFVNRASRSVG